MSNVEGIAMCALPQKHNWTVDEYLEFERESDEKHEYIDGEIFDRVGGSNNHSVITANTIGTFIAQLRSREDCIVYSSDMRIRIDARKYVYPDVSVVCGQAVIEERKGIDALLNPTVVGEVLSPSTEAYDRSTKFELYRRIESLQDYILIAQDRPRIEHYRRHDAGQWLYVDAVGLDSTLELPSIGCTLPLAEVYRKVTFDSQDA